MVFKVSADGAFTVLYTFTGGTDGGNPSGSMIADEGHNFFGTAFSGGRFHGGAAFTLSHAGKFRVLYSFCSLAKCVDGANPQGPLYADKKGNLYGTTRVGGTPVVGCPVPSFCGTVFELTRTGFVPP